MLGSARQGAKDAVARDSPIASRAGSRQPGARGSAACQRPRGSQGRRGRRHRSSGSEWRWPSPSGWPCSQAGSGPSCSRPWRRGCRTTGTPRSPGRWVGARRRSGPSPTGRAAPDAAASVRFERRRTGSPCTYRVLRPRAPGRHRPLLRHGGIEVQPLAAHAAPAEGGFACEIERCTLKAFLRDLPLGGAQPVCAVATLCQPERAG